MFNLQSRLASDNGKLHVRYILDLLGHKVVYLLAVSRTPDMAFVDRI